MAVTEKLTGGDTDIKAATGHTSDAMIRNTYDRRRVRLATGPKMVR